MAVEVFLVTHVDLVDLFMIGILLRPNIRLNQFNLLVYRQNSLKRYSRLVGKIIFFLFNSQGRHFGKKKYFFSFNEEEKAVIALVHSIYSLCNKTETHF